MRRLTAGSVLLGLALLTTHRATVWTSDQALWTDASTTAPMKPRVAVNLAVAAMTRDDVDTATFWLDRAEHLADTRRGWEQSHTRDLVAVNRAVLEMRTGHMLAGLDRLARAADTNAMAFELCARFRCRADVVIVPR